MHLLTLVFVSLFLLSCGKSDSLAGYPKERQLPQFNPVEKEVPETVLISKFHSLHPEYQEVLGSSVIMKIRENKIFMEVKVKTSSPHAHFFQHIYLGRKCPSKKDDLNGDLILDAQEMKSIVGPVLYNLEAGLEEILSDEEGWKLFRWEEDLVKKINFDGHVLILHGAPDSIMLPDSVLGIENKLPYESLPIACGVLRNKQRTLLENEIKPPPHSENNADDEDEDEDERTRRSPLLDWWRSIWRS